MNTNNGEHRKHTNQSKGIQTNGYKERKQRDTDYGKQRETQKRNPMEYKCMQRNANEYKQRDTNKGNKMNTHKRKTNEHTQWEPTEYNRIQAH